MGCNYYATKQNVTSAGNICIVEDVKVHIGKSSHGWQFLFCKNSQLNIHSYAEWKDWLIDADIEDEYGEPISLVELDILIQRKKSGFDLTAYYEHYPRENFIPVTDTECKDSEGYRFSTSEEFC